jgi:hypothetical protein
VVVRTRRPREDATNVGKREESVLSRGALFEK